MTPRQQVYFIQGPPDGPIKIGISVDPEERLRTFQTASPHRLRILRLEPGGRSRELALHRRWHRHRLEGEWFRPEPILKYIATAPAGYAPRMPSLPSFGWLAVIPRGAWRILAALVLSMFGSKRRKREVRPLAALGLLPPAAWATLAYVPTNTPPNVAIWMAVAVLLIACTIAGTVKA